MIRRIPYLKVNNSGVHYLCPQCKSEIPRDMYKTSETCPVCYSYINRTCKSMMKTYKDIDIGLYKFFIQLLRR